jgi:hypothetical protein
MSFQIRRVDYYYTVVKDEPGESYQTLSQLAHLGINLLAFSAVPVGPESTQLTLFPEISEHLEREALKAGMKMEGPHVAFLVQGDDKLGALAGVHDRLFHAHINVFASMGVTDGKGSFGYLIYVRPEDYERAAEALGL